MPEAVTGYPILLNLVDKQCVVVGGGRVATRKVRGLLDAGAFVAVISPEVTPELKALVDEKKIEWSESRYKRDMLNYFMPILVISVTGDERVNQTVAQDARRIRAWVNVTDNRDESDFSNMATFKRPPVTVALSTNGTSPALLRLLKAEIELFIGEEYTILADWLGTVRDSLKEDVDGQAERQEIYQRILQSKVLELLKQGQNDAAWDSFQQIIAQEIKQ